MAGSLVCTSAARPSASSPSPRRLARNALRAGRVCDEADGDQASGARLLWRGIGLRGRRPERPEYRSGSRLPNHLSVGTTVCDLDERREPVCGRWRHRGLHSECPPSASTGTTSLRCSQLRITRGGSLRGGQADADRGDDLSDWRIRRATTTPSTAIRVRPRRLGLNAPTGRRARRSCALGGIFTPRAGQRPEEDSIRLEARRQAIASLNKAHAVGGRRRAISSQICVPTPILREQRAAQKQIDLPGALQELFDAEQLEGL